MAKVEASRVQRVLKQILRLRLRMTSCCQALARIERALSSAEQSEARDFLLIAIRTQIFEKFNPDVEKAWSLLFCHAELAPRFVEKTEIGDLRNTEGLRDFRVFTHQIDHQLNPFGFDRHVAHNTAPELLEHFGSESPVGQSPLSQNDIDHLVSVARFEAEKKTTQCGSNHAADFVCILLDFFSGRTKTVLRKTQDVAQEQQLVIALVDGDNVFGHAEQRGVNRAGLERGEPVVPERNDRDIAARFQTEMLERGVGHQGCRSTRGAAGHFLSLSMARFAYVFSSNKR